MNKSGGEKQEIWGTEKVEPSLAPCSDVFKLQVDCYFYANGGNRHPASRPANKKKKKL